LPVAPSGNPSETYGASPAIWVHTCHPTQVNAPHLTQPGRPVLDLPTPSDERLSWLWRLVICWDGLPVHRQSPIQVVTTC